MNRRGKRQARRQASGPAAVAKLPAPAVLAELMPRAVAAHREGRLTEALAGYRAVLKEAPRYAPALSLAGVAAFHLGQEAEALRLLQAAVRAAPDDPEAHSNLGNVLKARGRSAEAAAAYGRALALAPDYAGAAFNLGVLLNEGGESAAAAEAFEKALAADPGLVEAQVALASLRKAEGRHGEALSACEAALALDPEHPGALVNRAAVLHELGREEEALQTARAASAAAPNLADAAYNEALALQALARLDEAAEAYRRTLALDPGYAPAALNLGYALHALGQRLEAESSLRQAIALWPDYAQPAINLADLYLDLDRPESAVAVCRDFLRRNPGDAGMLSMLALCLREAGHEAEASAIADPAPLLQQQELPVPPGFPDLKAFNEALVRHLLAHPSLARAPASHATRDGQHSGELLRDPKGPVADLEAAIERAATAWLHNPPPLPPDLLGPWPKRWRLTLWGVALAAQGRQVPHNHPAARLSGVYYAALPEGLGAEDSKAGWLEFGRPPEHYHAQRRPALTAIRPKEGLLVLFPSHLWHRTLPFEGQGLRVSFAFDLLTSRGRRT